MRRLPLSLLLLGLACGGDSTGPRSDLMFQHPDIALHESENLIVELSGGDTTTGFQWSSTNVRVATVSGTNGRATVTPVSTGDAFIQATRAGSTPSLATHVLASCDTVHIALPFLRETSIVRAASCEQRSQFYAADNSGSTSVLYKLNVRNQTFAVAVIPVALHGEALAYIAPARSTPVSILVVVPAKSSVPFSVAVNNTPPALPGPGGTFTMDAAEVPLLAECTRVWMVVGSRVKGNLGPSACLRTITGSLGQLSHEFAVVAPAGKSVLVRLVTAGFEPALEWRGLDGAPIASVVAALASNSITIRFTATGGAHFLALGTRGLGQVGTYTLSIED